MNLDYTRFTLGFQIPYIYLSVYPTLKFFVSNLFTIYQMIHIDDSCQQPRDKPDHSEMLYNLTVWICTISLIATQVWQINLALYSLILGTQYTQCFVYAYGHHILVEGRCYNLTCFTCSRYDSMLQVLIHILIVLLLLCTCANHHECNNSDVTSTWCSAYICIANWPCNKSFCYTLKWNIWIGKPVVPLHYRVEYITITHNK